MNIQRVASGSLVEVDDTGLATYITCGWLVRVANGNPEPSCEDDAYDIVPCPAKVRSIHPDPNYGHWVCRNGHERMPMEMDLAPGGPAWQREQAEAMEARGW